MTDRIRIGISGCLLGQPVRYDGGHKKNVYLTESLGRFFEYVPFCPEVAVGMGVPRAPIQLVKTRAGIRALGVVDPQIDMTNSLAEYAASVAEQMTFVSGYIFKSNSPSCGMERVSVHRQKSASIGNGTGIFAGALMKLLPELPVEDEGRLMNPVLRDNFLERVFVYHRWKTLAERRISANALVVFHSRHKFIVLAHDEKFYRALGRLVAAAGSKSAATVGAQYIRILMQALKQPATRARHVNVLQHLLGFLKERIDTADKTELNEAIRHYRYGRVPWSVPVTLLRHHIRRFPDEYLENQYYLFPSPGEFIARNQV